MNRTDRRSFLVAPTLAGAALVGLGALGCEPQPATEPEPGAGPASSSIAVASDDRHLLVASEDHDALFVVERDGKRVVAEIATGDGPTHVVALSGDRAAVTNRYAHTVSIVDVEGGVKIADVVVGVEPYGLARIGDEELAVVLAGEGAVAIVNVDDATVTRKIPVPAADPRAVALVGDELFVSHMAAGVLSRVRLDGSAPRVVDVATTTEHEPVLFPNHLRSLTVAPDARSIFIAHSHTTDATVRTPLTIESFEGSGCGYSGCAHEVGAVVPGQTEIDIGTGTVVIPERVVDATETEDQEDFGDCFDCGPPARLVPTTVLNPFEQRFFGIPMNNPTAVAVVDGGHATLVLNLGSKNAVFLRRPLRGDDGDLLGVVTVGEGATGLALSRDGRSAFVWNQFDGAVTEIEVPRVERAEASSRFATGDTAFGETEAREGIPEWAPVDHVVIVGDALDWTVSHGRRLFHDATDGRLSQNNSISCASCHPDGRGDGRTWQFSFGPRNTPQLGGGILDTAPFHWPGDVTTHVDLNTMTVLAFMPGTGLDTDGMNAIGAFIDTIRSAPPSHAVVGEDEAIARGRAIFTSAEARCTECHFGDDYTDNQNWDVGTRAAFADIESFQTPVLHGLARSAPYLHDGSQPTLAALVDELVATNQMGTGSHLTAEERADLVAFLSSL